MFRVLLLFVTEYVARRMRIERQFLYKHRYNAQHAHILMSPMPYASTSIIVQGIIYDNSKAAQTGETLASCTDLSTEFR